MSRGFTLVELLIALALSAVIAGMVLFSFGQGERSRERAAARSARAQVRAIVAERMAGEIRAAGAVLSGSGSDEVLLKLGIGTVGYRLTENKVRRKAGTTTAFLTSDGEIKTLSFAYPAPDMVAVRLDGLYFQARLRN